MSVQAPSSLVSDCGGNEGRKVFSDVHLEAQADNSIISDFSNASFPLAQLAQRQRRLNSTSNLRRSRFTGPSFGLLSTPVDPAPPSGPAQAHSPQSEPSCSSSSSNQCQVERRDFPGEGDHISVPVFAISEEEDRQPLVPAEHLDRSASSAVLNGLVTGTFDGKLTAHFSPQRSRPEWRPWGSQVSGGACPHPPNLSTAESKAMEPPALSRVPADGP